MDRRNFIQMLGLGAAAAAVSSTAGASPVVPLFTGRESRIWTPEHTSLTAHHLVLTRPTRTPWQRAMTPFGADPTVLRVNRESWPKIGEKALHPVDDGGFWWNHSWVPAPEHGAVPPNVPALRVDIPEGADLHEAFYRGATWMRNSFAKQSQQRLLEIPQAQRPAYRLVTLVDTPVFASAVEPSTSGADRAFMLEISYTPYTASFEEIELNGWEVYSENGEYPVEVPTSIDLELLMSMDRKVVAGETTSGNMRGTLILPLDGRA